MLGCVPIKAGLQRLIKAVHGDVNIDQSSFPDGALAVHYMLNT